MAYNDYDTKSEYDLIQDIAFYMRGRMRGKGVTQRWLAQETDISEASISCYLKGTKRMGLVAFNNICLALDIDPAELLGVYMVDGNMKGINRRDMKPFRWE